MSTAPTQGEGDDRRRQDDREDEEANRRKRSRSQNAVDPQLRVEGHAIAQPPTHFPEHPGTQKEAGYEALERQDQLAAQASTPADGGMDGQEVPLEIRGRAVTHVSESQMLERVIAQVSEAQIHWHEKIISQLTEADMQTGLRGAQVSETQVVELRRAVTRPQTNRGVQLVEVARALTMHGTDGQLDYQELLQTMRDIVHVVTAPHPENPYNTAARGGGPPPLPPPTQQFTTSPYPPVEG